MDEKLFKKLDRREFREIAEINKAFHIDFYHLPLGLDIPFIQSVQAMLTQGPCLKKKTVLFVNDSQFKYHEKHILLFLNRKFKHCDCYNIANPNFSLKTSLKNVRYLTESIPDKFYDRVIVYRGLEFLLQNINKIKTDKFYVLLTNIDVVYIHKNQDTLDILKKLKNKIVYFNLFKNTLDYISPSASQIQFQDAINWPPNLDIFYHVPKKFVFDYLVMGGVSRDYRFLYNNRRLFKGKKVIITHCDANKYRRDQNERSYDMKYLGLLNKNKEFICLKRIHESLYCRLLLFSRITICMFRKKVGTDSTCISDAIWYGKPVLTTKTMATDHLKNHAFFIHNTKDMKTILHKLKDRSFYENMTKKITKYARKENNIFNLLKLIK